MITILLKENGEPNVTQLTYENLWREIKDIEKSEILIVKSWRETIPEAQNRLVSCVEPDCLVNSGYFKSMVGFLNKKEYGQISMLASAIGVNQWRPPFYGYMASDAFSGMIPDRQKKSSTLYPIEAGYFPGAVMRTKTMETILGKLEQEEDLPKLSVDVSFAAWENNESSMVYVNPNTTYITTDKDVNDVIDSVEPSIQLLERFKRESI